MRTPKPSRCHGSQWSRGTHVARSRVASPLVCQERNKLPPGTQVSRPGSKAPGCCGRRQWSPSARKSVRLVVPLIPVCRSGGAPPVSAACLGGPPLSDRRSPLPSRCRHPRPSIWPRARSPCQLVPQLHEFACIQSSYCLWNTGHCIVKMSAPDTFRSRDVRRRMSGQTGVLAAAPPSSPRSAARWRRIREARSTRVHGTMAQDPGRRVDRLGPCCRLRRRRVLCCAGTRRTDDRPRNMREVDWGHK